VVKEILLRLRANLSIIAVRLGNLPENLLNRQCQKYFPTGPVLTAVLTENRAASKMIF
jgi:hypothetical protein